jgi:hypothetical protein
MQVQPPKYMCMRITRDSQLQVTREWKKEVQINEEKSLMKSIREMITANSFNCHYMILFVCFVCIVCLIGVVPVVRMNDGNQNPSSVIISAVSSEGTSN